MRSHSAPSCGDRHCKATLSERAAMDRARTRSPSRASSIEGVSWRRSPSRSRSKSVPRVKQPEWMAATNVRLTATAEVAEAAAEQGGQDLKALYVMTPKEVAKAASSQPQTNLADTTGAKAALSSQPPRSHREAALNIHRLTGGGPKLPSSEAGPIATSVNPARFAMMINGRPVVVLRVLKAARSFQPCAMLQTSGRLVFVLLCRQLCSFSWSYWIW